MNIFLHCSTFIMILPYGYCLPGCFGSSAVPRHPPWASAVEEKESEPECVQKPSPRSGVDGRVVRLQPRQLRDCTCALLQKFSLLPRTASFSLRSLPHCSCLLAVRCLLVSLHEGKWAQKGLRAEQIFLKVQGGTGLALLADIKFLDYLWASFIHDILTSHYQR